MWLWVARVWVGIGFMLWSGRAVAQASGQAPAVQTPAPVSNSELPPENEEPLRYEEPKKPDAPSQRVSITFSPLHLISPIFELEAEIMVVPHFGVGVIGGIGSIEAETGDPEIGNERFQAYELGLQLAGYPLRDFHSLELGVEVLWVNVRSENIDGQDVRGEGSGIAVGPFVGYKLMTDVGFTFFVQGGLQMVTATAEATDAEGNTDTAEESGLIPLLNLNVGWSF